MTVNVCKGVEWSRVRSSNTMSCVTSYKFIHISSISRHNTNYTL